jgi:hypothetical protein
MLLTRSEAIKGSQFTISLSFFFFFFFFLLFSFFFFLFVSPRVLQSNSSSKDELEPTAHVIHIVVAVEGDDAPAKLFPHDSTDREAAKVLLSIRNPRTGLYG